MKTPLQFQFSSAPLRAAFPKFILSGLIAATASLVFAASGTAQGTTQPFSAFPVIVDGQFTGAGEWSDVTPSAFISSPGTTAVPTTLGDPLANSLLYATLARTTPVADPFLYLMYDFLPRTNAVVAPNEVFASVAFQITLPGRPTGDRTSIAVLFAGKSGGSTFKGDSGVAVPSFFDVFIDLNLDGNPDGQASAFGITGAAGFGPSSLSATPHLLVELEVQLRIPAGFANPPAPTGPLPGGGINPATGAYDPDPIFWGAAGGADGTLPAFGETLQSASGGIFEINPDGSTSITPTPEPTSAALLLGSLGLFAARRRRAVAA